MEGTVESTELWRTFFQGKMLMHESIYLMSFYFYVPRLGNDGQHAFLIVQRSEFEFCRKEKIKINKKRPGMASTKLRYNVRSVL